MKRKEHVQPKTKGAANVPVVMQMENVECGAASLAMILGYYGRYVPLSQMRKDCGVSRDGSNAGYLLAAAQNYGLLGKAYRFSADELKRMATYPCILFWDQNHFVVLTGFKKNIFYINDPAKGSLKYTQKNFEKHYSGVCLAFKPKEDFEPGGKPDSIWNFAGRQLKGAGKMIMMVSLTFATVMLINMLMPIMPRILVDYVLENGSGRLWKGAFFALFIFIAIAKGISEIIETAYLLKLRGKMAMTAHTSFIWHILRLPMDYFTQRYNSDLIARKNSLDGISSVFILRITPVILDLFSIFFYLFMMLTYSPILSAVGIFFLILNMVVSGIILKAKLNLTRREMKNTMENNMDTYVGVRMIETIKSAGAEEGFFEKWSGTHSECVRTAAEMNKNQGLFTFLPGLLSELCSAIVLCMAVRFLMNGDWTMGMISAFMSYLSAFSNPVKKILGVYQELQTLGIEITRYEDVMLYETDIPEEMPAVDESTQYSLLSGEIEFKDVSFGYCSMDTPLIKDFSMKVDAGKSVAFVGSSGSGKSTLAKLISGLYKPRTGCIYFDGKPMDSIPREIRSASIVTVDQDISLFSDSIANNIKLWDESIEDYEMIMAARDAHIHDEIAERDKGYQSEVLDGGKNFSGGQRQRLEIARALAVNPSIIVLDEATAALDTQTEYDIMKSIRDLGITMVVISHRLSTIRDCDEIIVLDNGEVIDRGAHDELMNRCDYYRKLISWE